MYRLPIVIRTLLPPILLTILTSAPHTPHTHILTYRTGAWRLSDNWDEGKVPCTNDTVAIPAKTTVVINPGTQATAKRLEVTGNLKIMKGSFGIRIYKNKSCSRLETTARFDSDDDLFWLNGNNWDDNNVPCSADVTMIPKEQTVMISKATTAETKMLKVAGRINIAGGIRIYKKGKASCDVEMDSNPTQPPASTNPGEKQPGPGSPGGASGGESDGGAGEADTDDAIQGSIDEFDGGSSGGGPSAGVVVVIVLLILALLIGGFLYKRQQDQINEMKANGGGDGSGEEGALATSVGTRKAVATHHNPTFSMAAAADAGGAGNEDGYLDVSAEEQGRDGMDNGLYDGSAANEGEGNYDAVPGMVNENYDALPAEGDETYEDIASGSGSATTDTEFVGFEDANYDTLPADAGHAASNPADTYEDVDGYTAPADEAATYDEMPAVAAAATAEATYEEVSGGGFASIDNAYDENGRGVDI